MSDSNTRRRKTRQVVCLQCSKHTMAYSYDKSRFCSKECYYIFQRERRPLTCCTVCHKEFRIGYYREGRNKQSYCSRECYNHRRAEDLKRLKRHTSYFTGLVGKGCDCGVTEYYLLQIHHKDGDTSNNSEDNLEVVCANCHIKRHLKQNRNGKLVYHTKTLTSPEVLKIIEHGQNQNSRPA